MSNKYKTQKLLCKIYHPPYFDYYKTKEIVEIATNIPPYTTPLK